MPYVFSFFLMSFSYIFCSSFYNLAPATVKHRRSSYGGPFNKNDLRFFFRVTFQCKQNTKISITTKQNVTNQYNQICSSACYRIKSMDFFNIIHMLSMSSAFGFKIQLQSKPLEKKFVHYLCTLRHIFSSYRWLTLR